MPQVLQVLHSLNPSITHEMIKEGDKVVLRLIDEKLKIEVRRSMAGHELNNPQAFRLIVMYALNELRAKGSQAQLPVLPHWD